MLISILVWMRRAEFSVLIAKEGHNRPTFKQFLKDEAANSSSVIVSSSH